jgi:hypothetical protein
MKPEDIDDIFNEEGYEYGEPGEFSKNLPVFNKEHKQAQKELNTHRTQVVELLNKSTNDIESIGDIKQDYIGIEPVSIPDKLITTNSIESDTKKTDKPWQFKKGQSGNPSGKPKTEKRTISSLIDAKLSKEKEATKFTDHLFELYYAENNKQALSAGIEILNRHEGKVKDVIQVGPITAHIPDQEEQLKIANSFKVGTITAITKETRNRTNDTSF